MVAKGKSIKEELEDKCVIQILISLETQLNALPPNGNVIMSHEKQTLYAKLFYSREDVSKKHIKKITFKELRERETNIFTRTQSLMLERLFSATLVTLNFSSPKTFQHFS